MPDFKYAKGRIVESLQFISIEIKEFDEDYASKTWVKNILKKDFIKLLKNI